MATFSRIKTWVSNEVLTAADLNAEFDNIINNMGPAGIEDASQNVSAMQANVDPGGLGSESLATSLLGEIHRLRFVIKRIVGDQWYSYAGRSLKTGDMKIKSADIDAGEVKTANIADNAVETAKINDAAVETAKIKDAAVTYPKLGPINTAATSTILSQTSDPSHSDFEDISSFGNPYLVNITPHGRPVLIQILSDDNIAATFGSDLSVDRNGSSGAPTNAPYLRVKRTKVSDSSVSYLQAYQFKLPSISVSVTGSNTPLPTVGAVPDYAYFNPCLTWLDLTAEAGEEYSYTIQLASGALFGASRQLVRITAVVLRVTEI
jgi:hypothetical protein